MNNLNSILAEGSMVRDPLLRSTPKGTAVCTFTIATCRFHRNGDGFEKEVSFFNVETWAKLAESCYQLGKKGKGVRVIGRLKQDRWQDKDGKSHEKIVIVAEHVEFRPDIKKNADAEPEEAQEAIEHDALLDDAITDESGIVEEAGEVKAEGNVCW